jgi:hypothetical protein
MNKNILKMLTEMSNSITNPNKIKETSQNLLSDIEKLKSKIENNLLNSRGKVTTGAKSLLASLKDTESNIQQIIKQSNMSSVEDLKLLSENLSNEVNRTKESIAKIPEIPNAIMVRDSLESLKDEERLDVSAIKGIEKSNSTLSDLIEKRAISIVDQRTSFLIQKVSNLSDKLAASGIADGITIGDLITSATAGSVLYVSSTNALAQDNPYFYYDATNHNLRLGPTDATITTQNRLSLIGNANDYSNLLIRNQSAGTLASADITLANDSTSQLDYFDMGVNSSGNTNPLYTGFLASDFYMYTAGTVKSINIATGSDNPIRFFVNGYLTANKKLEITNTDLLFNGFSIPTEINNKSQAGGLYFDGVTASSRVYHTLNQDIGTSDFSMYARVMVPTSNPGASAVIVGVSSANTTPIAALGSYMYISTTGALITRVFGATGSDYIRSEYNNFITNYGGKIVDLVMVRNTAASTMTLYINGVAQTPTLNSEVVGTATWAGSVTSIYFLLSATSNLYTDRIYKASLFNRALSISDIQKLEERGISYSDQWGSQTASYTSDFSAGVDSWGASIGTVTGNIDGIGGQDNNLRYYADNTLGIHRFFKTSSLLSNKRYKVSFDYYIPSANTNLKKVKLMAGGYDVTPTSPYGDTLDAWTTYTTGEIITSPLSSGTLLLYTYNAANTQYTGAGVDTDDLIYVRNVTITPIGTMLDSDLENADPAKSLIVRDRSTNKFTGVVTATGVTQIKSNIQLNPNIIVMDAGTGTAGASGLTGGWFNQVARTYTDNVTAASGTAASFGFNNFAIPTLAATNATVTTTNAATVYIAGAPANGTNMTVTSPLALWIDAGNARFDGNLNFGVAASGITLKQGANGRCGTFTANGATPVTVSNTSVEITDTIVFSLNTVGGTVGAYPTIPTITASTGFTTVATAGDTSVYNYIIIKNVA